jgi:hypothetical protein
MDAVIFTLVPTIQESTDHLTFPSLTRNLSVRFLPFYNTSTFYYCSLIFTEYIIGFHSYIPQDLHMSTLAETLGVDGWKLVPRNNPASSLPSDFAVIRVRSLLLRSSRREKKRMHLLGAISLRGS